MTFSASTFQDNNGMLQFCQFLAVKIRLETVL